MSIVGYQIGGHDNGTMMFEVPSGSECCPVCRNRYNPFSHNPYYRQSRRRTSALLSTYDNFSIVNQAFRNFCNRPEYRNVYCIPFDDDDEHFHLVVREPVLAFDYRRRKTKFLDYCPACERYGSIIGANPVYLLIREELSDGFYRTDLEFGSRNGKQPLVIVGRETREKMKAASLKGILFHDAVGQD